MSSCRSVAHIEFYACNIHGLSSLYFLAIKEQNIKHLVEKHKLANSRCCKDCKVVAGER